MTPMPKTDLAQSQDTGWDLQDSGGAYQGGGMTSSIMSGGGAVKSLPNPGGGADMSSRGSRRRVRTLHPCWRQVMEGQRPH